MNVLQWGETQVFTFFFVLVRVTSLMFFVPIFGDRTIPSTVKILFGLSLAFVSFPIAWAQGVRVDPSIAESLWRSGWAVICDVGFGMMVGFIARWIFDAVQLAGNLAGTTMGFSIATVLDPHSESQTIALSELQYILAAMLFLSMDGHHFYLRAILRSFELVPLTGVNFLAHGSDAIQFIIRMTSEVLLLGVKLAAPVIVVVFLINIAFGIMARAVPQMNVLVVSFAANIIIGLLVTVISLTGFLNQVQEGFAAVTPELFRFMKLFAG